LGLSPSAKACADAPVAGLLLGVFGATTSALNALTGNRAAF
jgi:hypothetical protein